MFKPDRMGEAQGAAVLRNQRLTAAVADLQNRLERLASRSKEPSDLRMRNLVHDRLQRVHRRLAARLEIAEGHSGAA